ncbi:DUF2510 domain-containing protein [Streptomyces daliensis]|uniref:DUF2510 domain-containing protein n=1 Tax=Streptomyces daliensis TaxID=299421 RepID=A0A8T4IQC4_9ACTN|nr:DUF2510 domain-containing protein [Streptomyces daliensis]
MNTETPPGWYPDPGHAGKGPAQERWWDGTAWTAQTRTRGPARVPLVAGIVGALVLVAALIVGGILFVGAADDEDSGPRERAGSSDGPGFGSPQPSPSGPQRQGPPGQEGPGQEGPQQNPEAPPGQQQPDLPASGVELPVLDGWKDEGGGAMVTMGEYKCPGDSGETCLRGAAMVIVATSEGSAEKVAKADIEKHAESAYSKETYGGITSHKVLATEKTTVAGEDAYRVRWKITNKVKPDAYVESVAFPHPDGSGQMLVLRTGFDIHKDAPPQDDMEKLSEGIKENPNATGGGTGGNGKEIAYRH